MEDSDIIALYWQRDETAIRETDTRYGRFCHKLAYQILSVPEDAEECVNDAYWKTWNAIPPQKPDCLQAWLGRVVRNLALNLWKKNHRQKRYAGIEQLFEELEECIPAAANVETEIDAAELTELMNQWLAGLPASDRVLFLRRYWNGEPTKALAALYHTTPSHIANRLYRLRQQLKARLEKEEIRL